MLNFPEFEQLTIKMRDASPARTRLVRTLKQVRTGRCKRTQSARRSLHEPRRSSVSCSIDDSPTNPQQALGGTNFRDGYIFTASNCIYIDVNVKRY